MSHEAKNGEGSGGDDVTAPTVTASSDGEVGDAATPGEGSGEGQQRLLYLAPAIIQCLNKLATSNKAVEHTHHYHIIPGRPGVFRCCSCCLGLTLRVTDEGESPHTCQHMFQQMPCVRVQPLSSFFFLHSCCVVLQDVSLSLCGRARGGGGGGGGGVCVCLGALPV